MERKVGTIRTIRDLGNFSTARQYGDGLFLLNRDGDQQRSGSRIWRRMEHKTPVDFGGTFKEDSDSRLTDN